jgi:hypothetical protein
MNHTPRFLALAVLLATAACNNGSNTPVDASTDAPTKDVVGKDVVQNDTGVPDSGGGDSGGGQTIDPACTAAGADAGSGGSCIAITGDGGVECNPITNSPCNADAGEACDFSQGGFHCYPPPPANTATLCQACDLTNGPACVGTATCVPTPNGNECARYCCDDTDCGSGHCDKTTFQSDPIGFCVK